MTLRGKTASDLLRQAIRETTYGLCGAPQPADDEQLRLL